MAEELVILGALLVYGRHIPLYLLLSQLFIRRLALDAALYLACFVGVYEYTERILVLKDVVSAAAYDDAV